MKPSHLLGAICALFLIFSIPAHAATVSFTGSFSGSTDVTDQVINVSQFDPLLGTLVSATFELSATMTTAASVTNDGDFYVGWDKTIYDLSLQGDTAYNGVAISASNPSTRIVGTGTPGTTFGLGNMLHVIGSPNWTQSGPTLNESNNFNESPIAAFLGTGDLSFFLTTENYDILSAAGTGSPSTSGFSTDIFGEVTVTYEFNPVPVPAAVWLFGSGLLGLVGIARRKKA